MFNTIKSKILVITVSMLAALTIVMTCFTYIFLKTTKSLLLVSYSQTIGIFAQEINKEVAKIENNSKDFALLGELLYKKKLTEQTTETTIIDTLKIYKDSLGGGIWYEPYKINKTKRHNSIYAFRNKQNKVVPDDSFNTDEYDYLNQKWYKEIFSNVTKENDTDWSSPYKETQGSNTLMITAGTGMFDDNGNIIGISTVDWEISSILENISQMKPTPNSFALFADTDNDYILVSTDQYLDNKNLVGKSLKNIPWYNNNLKQKTYFTYHNKKFIPYVKTLDNNMILIVCIPKQEIFAQAIIHVVILFAILIIISSLISYFLYLILKNSIIKPIDKLTLIANKIGKGEEAKIKISNPEEFAHLATTFDNMTQSIKTITKERERINSELNIAKEIQASSLPSVFPAFPNQNDFDIYASMTPAREVGGDFYDFYFIDDDNFMFLIADVSGKGIPAALFMMTTKTLIHNISQAGYGPKELIRTINKEICQNNQQGLFITMFTGIVNIKTGKITYINCGHNPPLIKTQNDKYKYLDLPSNIVLGAFESADFEIKEAQLKKGDTIFLYTDGITEAINSNGEMFSEKRLISCVNEIDSNDLKAIADKIRNEVVKYSEGTNQSDDLTMVIFKYQNNTETKTYQDFALKDNYKNVCEWLHNTCDEWALAQEVVKKLDMCAEEIFANITFYAYPNSTGKIKISLTKTENEIILQTEDEGIEYNPLKKPDPDINLPPEERQLGGLGIFMVKELADNIKYKYSDNKNILTIFFNTL